MLTALLTALLAAGAAIASPLAKRDFGPVTIFDPPADYNIPRTLYARGLRLNDTAGTWLSTWENYTPNGTLPYFQIYQSTDQGYSWSLRSRVYDTQNGWGLRYQPQMIQLEAPFAQFDTGTILLAGNSIPENLTNTQLDLYASTDEGYSWSFVSHIAAGGFALPDDGLTPVWEPFLMVYGDQLICYYSDQRDPQYSQKLVYQATSDLVNWGSVVDTVTVANQTARPGMSIVSLMGNGNYIMTYENGGAPEVNFAVYYKITDNPLDFASAPGQVLRTTDGYVPFSTPYNVWTDVESSNGTLVVSSYSDSDLFINHGYGEGEWTRLATQITAAYSRSLVLGCKDDELYIFSGGALAGANNTVQVAEQNLHGC